MSTPSNRRALVRQLCGPQTSGRLRAASTGGTLWARVRDASTGGLGLLVSRPLAPGSFLAVELRAPGMRYALVLEARVARAALQPDGSWLLGCVLLYKLPEEMLPALAAAGADAEDRPLVVPAVEEAFR
jgi:hypothetical protein